jgi:hypothetical protein
MKSNGWISANGVDQSLELIVFSETAPASCDSSQERGLDQGKAKVLFKSL